MFTINDIKRLEKIQSRELKEKELLKQQDLLVLDRFKEDLLEGFISHMESDIHAAFSQAIIKRNCQIADVYCGVWDSKNEDSYERKIFENLKALSKKEALDYIKLDYEEIIRTMVSDDFLVLNAKKVPIDFFSEEVQKEIKEGLSIVAIIWGKSKEEIQKTIKV